MNAAQIAKLQKKVAAQVSVKFKKEEEEHKKKLDSIRRMIEVIENENPNRGICIASYRGIIYRLHKSMLIISNDVKPSDGFDMVEACGGNSPYGERYWMLKPEVFKEYQEISEWLKVNYALVRMVVARLKNEKGMESISSAFQLGTIFEDFQKKFPNKSMVEFIQYIKTMDRFLMDAANDG